jgi:anti-anti-sigma regulatory factor
LSKRFNRMPEAMRVALRQFHQRFSEQGGALLIASPSPALTRLLNITGLDKHLNVAEPSGEE